MGNEPDTYYQRNIFVLEHGNRLVVDGVHVSIHSTHISSNMVAGQERITHHRYFRNISQCFRYLS